MLTLVAAEDGDVIGWARLLPWRQRGYDVVEDLVYVDPLYHRRGVDDPHRVDGLPLADDRRRELVLAGVGAADRAEAHPAAVDAAERRLVQRQRGGPQRVRGHRAADGRQHAVEQGPAADESGHG